MLKKISEILNFQKNRRYIKIKHRCSNRTYKSSRRSQKKAIELEKQQKSRRKTTKKIRSTTKKEKNIKGTEKETTTLGKAAKQVFSYGVAFNALRKNLSRNY